MSPPKDSAPTLVLSEAKLAPPRPRASMLPRHRLFGELDQLADVKLTLVSAPAGSGKTVVVASWLEHRADRTAAWVSLEQGDDDPVRLWTAVSTAVDRLRPGIARPALAVLRSPRTDIETAIDELLNGLAGYVGLTVIVLDDLHHVNADAGLRSLAYAVERLPHTTRMVATTRSDPAIRLGRLRARGELGELRARDLAFTVDEVEAFLAAHGVTALRRDDVERLVERTEGWPAGVGLAGMWLAKTDAPEAELREFSASNRHVTDYLTSEVLDTLDDATRTFLLRTSVLERFTAGLCDTVLEVDDSAEMLESLMRSNLFLVALDGRGEWFRYHHLFRELLAAELNRDDPAAARALHQRAADWFRGQGLIEDALEHTAALGDPAALADLLQAEQVAMIRFGMESSFMSWLERVDSSALDSRPALAVAGALAAGMLARPAAVRRRYAAVAEAGLATAPEPVRLFVQSVAAVTRGGIVDGELGLVTADTVAAAEMAKVRMPDMAVTLLGILAHLHYLGGADDLAREIADEALAHPGAPARPHGLVYAHAVHALVEADAGRGEPAEAEARHAVARARELGLAGSWSAGVAHHALGAVLLARGHAQEAERELQRAARLRRAVEPRLDTIHTLIHLAGAQVALGRLTVAATTLNRANELLTAFTDAGRLPGEARAVGTALAAAQDGSQPAIEPPTPAELAVLQLLATDLSQREIGDELFLSLNTVKTHSRNLYAKLGAHSREEAVQKAHILGLVG